MVSLSNPAITVAMSVYNNAATLAVAIDSILAQRFTAFEFIIVDDGSTDGSSAIIDAAAARDPRVRVVRQANHGLVASLNRAIGDARAPLIARMDGDDIAEPERFGAQHAFLTSHPEVGVIGTRVTCIDASGEIHSGRRLDHPTTDEGFRAALLGGPLICHPSVMMRTGLLREVGGYRTAYRHAEDYDLWLRLAPITQLFSLPERLLRYRSSPKQVSSRHLFEMLTAAAIARAAYVARRDDGRDPTDGMESLPPLDALDALFGRLGVTATARRQIVEGMLHDVDCLDGRGRSLMLAHLAALGSAGERPTPALWRTAGRLARHGRLPAAAQMLAALIRT